MAKYGRDHLGREIYKEDDNGNRTYNMSYIKKHFGNNDDSNSALGGCPPLQMIAAVGLLLVSLLFGFLFIYWGITENMNAAGVIFMLIFPVCGLIMSITWIWMLLFTSKE